MIRRLFNNPNNVYQSKAPVLSGITKQSTRLLSFFRWLTLVWLVIGLASPALSGSPTAENGKTDISKQIEQLDKSKKDWVSLQLNILNVSEQWVNNEKAIVVTFSHELANKTNFDRFMTVTEEKIAVKGKWKLLEGAPNSVYFSPIKPDKYYEVFVRPGIKSKKSLQLLTPTHYSVPSESFVPSLEFSANTLSLAAGKPNDITVGSAGVKQLDVKLFKISDKNHQAFWSYWQSHPDPSMWNDSVLSFLGKPLQQERFTYEVVPQKRQMQSLDWFNGSPKEKGAYIVQIRSQVELADTIPELKVHYYWFNVSDVLFSVDQYQYEMLAGIYDRATGHLLQDIPVSIAQAQQVEKLKTNQDGLIKIPKANKAKQALFLVESKGGISLYQRTLDHYQQTTHGHQINRRAFLDISKSVYSLKESLQFEALVDNAGKPMADREIEVFIESTHDPAKKYREWRMTDHLGYFDFSMPLKSNFDFGKWRLQLKLPENGEILASQYFFIWSENPTNFDLSLSLKNKYLFPNQTSVLNIDANLPNKEANQSNVVVNVKRLVKWQSDLMDDFPGYHFGEAEDVVLSGQESLKPINLSAAGTAEIKLAGIKSKITSPLLIAYKGELLVNDHVVADDEVSQLFLPSKAIVGVKPVFESSSEQEGEGVKVTFRVIKTNAKRELLSSGSLNIRLIRWDEELGIEFGVAEPYLTFESGQMGSLTLPVEEGNYRLEINDTATSLKTVYPFSVGDEGMSSKNQDDFRLMFEQDDMTYAPKDTVKLSLIGNVDSEVVVSLIGEDVLWTQRLDSIDVEQHLSIPVDPAWLGDKLSRELMLSVAGWQFNSSKKQFERVTASSPILLEQTPEIVSGVYDKQAQTLMFQLAGAARKVGVMVVKAELNNGELFEDVHIQPIFFGSTGWTKINLQQWQPYLDEIKLLNIHLHFENEAKDIYLSLDQVASEAN